MQNSQKINQEVIDFDDEPNPLQEFLFTEDLVGLTQPTKKHTNQIITIKIKCVYPDPQNPGEMLQRIGTKTCSASDKVEKVAKDFLDTYPDIPQDKEYYLGYNQLLFRSGTLQECGITQGKSVDLFAPGKNAAAYHNEGLKFITWAIIPLVIGLSALFYTFSADVSNEYQALALFVGLIFTIPSFICIIIGSTLIPGCHMPCYFTGTEWC
ncbi:hypothetical protein GPJ56_008682 [Histomonas meleagridis]|uniref:uncharacterized protein n=1 Tax=Histomonas meleagridis TaxID=135588 RepID=UPI00355A2FFC|nr:hypothetical protein GPJ56_008682 [Histomonas meleagridis]KAH0805739.1 hypothetical protein GO595_001378 [Histomonas meleagridis]